MLYTHTIGRIGKDCQVITGTHGTFMAVDIAVDDYSKGQNITTWVRVRSSRENHVRLAEYLTKGRLILVEGTYLHITVERPPRREPHANLHQCGQHRFRQCREERGAERQPEEGCQERS